MSQPQELAEKSRGKSRRIPHPHGGVLVPGAGRGPAKGAPNAGGPPNAIRALLREEQGRTLGLQTCRPKCTLNPRSPL